MCGRRRMGRDVAGGEPKRATRARGKVEGPWSGVAEPPRARDSGKSKDPGKRSDTNTQIGELPSEASEAVPRASCRDHHFAPRVPLLAATTSLCALQQLLSAAGDPFAAPCWCRQLGLGFLAAAVAPQWRQRPLGSSSRSSWQCRSGCAKLTPHALSRQSSWWLAQRVPCRWHKAS